ncbi:phasin family protein [Qipengyuania sp. MTN3-11]|uniref:phasin family protein n=1 Tax=Qipengyuania sp. MTN3-11 TaxID=3056557 RepID=UPI0036F3AD17
MAESQSKIDAAAEKAYADASEKKNSEGVNAKAVEKAVEADTNKPAKAAKVAEAVAAKPKKKVAAKKASARKPAARKASKTNTAPAQAVVSKAARETKSTNTPTIAQLKDKIMDNVNSNEFSQKVKETAAEAQTRMKAAYEKGSEMTTEVVEFQKGNIEALVESGKLLAGGMQDMGRVYLEDAKLAAETVTEDVKKMAAVKSPTELFQLQGEMVRRNFDAAVARASRNVEMTTKLVNDAFAPISTRASIAAERMSKVAA